MSRAVSRLRSELTSGTKLEDLLNKISGLVAERSSRLVIQIGNERFNGRDLEDLVIDGSAMSDNIQFTRPGGMAVENYDNADVIIIKRLRTKKYLIKLAADANPA